MAFRFQNFPVYQETRRFIREIYRLANSLPGKEQFVLASQLKRAATSILLNIAEGASKKSDPEFNRFILIAIGSANEIVAILDIALDQKYIKTDTYNSFCLKAESIITAFKKAPDFQSGDELNADMSSSFRGKPRSLERGGCHQTIKRF